jgi:uncharacterized protein YndB with AHSA1/START domain
MMNAAEKPATQTIAVAYELPHPPEKVWRALTDAGLVARWLMVNDLRPVVGHRFTFKAQPMPGWDGVVQCEVLEVVPGERLSYSWRGGSEQISVLDTVVTWTLARTATGTRLSLEHSGFVPANAFAFEALGRGWRGKVGQALGEVVATLE